MTNSFAQRAQTFAGVARADAVLGERWLRKADLTRTVDLVGGDYSFDGPPLPDDQPVLQGLFHTEELRPGLVVHRTRVTDLADLRTSLLLQPGLKVVLVLDGACDITLGGHHLRLGPGHPSDGRPAQVGALMSLAEPDRFTRHWRLGRQESKVSITLRHDWLDHGGLLDEGPGLDAVRRFREEHLSRQDWQPSQRAQALARQMVHMPALQPFLRRLYLESRAVELVAEALGGLQPATPARADLAAAGAGLSVRDHRRLNELRAQLDRCDAALPDLATMARQVGMSMASLQRKFRLLTGQPLVGYVRARRLIQARLALERDGISIEQAAERAGYTSAANFATAFRRQHGLPPGRARRPV